MQNINEHHINKIKYYINALMCYVHFVFSGKSLTTWCNKHFLRSKDNTHLTREMSSKCTLFFYRLPRFFQNYMIHKLFFITVNNCAHVSNVHHKYNMIRPLLLNQLPYRVILLLKFIINRKMKGNFLNGAFKPCALRVFTE